MRPKRLWRRSVIPQKCLKTEDIGCFRINLVRCEHNEGDEPRYDVFMWEDYTVLDQRITGSLSLAERVFNLLADEAYVLVARQALGLSNRLKESVD